VLALPVGNDPVGNDPDGLKPPTGGDDGDGGDEAETDAVLEPGATAEEEDDVSTREDELDVSRLETASDVVEEVDSDLELGITEVVSLLLEETETTPVGEGEEGDGLEEAPKVELPAFVAPSTVDSEDGIDAVGAIVAVVAAGEVGATAGADPEDELGGLLGDAEADAEAIVEPGGYCENSG